MIEYRRLFVIIPITIYYKKTQDVLSRGPMVPNKNTLLSSPINSLIKKKSEIKLK